MDVNTETSSFVLNHRDNWGLLFLSTCSLDEVKIKPKN